MKTNETLREYLQFIFGQDLDLESIWDSIIRNNAFANFILGDLIFTSNADPYLDCAKRYKFHNIEDASLKRDKCEYTVVLTDIRTDMIRYLTWEHLLECVVEVQNKQNDNMEKSIKIECPEEYEIDRENSTFEKIVFKKIGTKPRSWEEYCKNTKRNGTYFIGPLSSIMESYCEHESLDIKFDKNSLPSKELAEAFLAMMQLMSLRQAWIGDWEPDWKAISEKKSNIVAYEGRIEINTSFIYSRALSFPTKEMATDFIDCFKDLLEKAKILL